jgi:hypothetical protein
MSISQKLAEIPCPDKGSGGYQPFFADNRD